jgi:hypothetical protein
LSGRERFARRSTPGRSFQIRLRIKLSQERGLQLPQSPAHPPASAVCYAVARLQSRVSSIDSPPYGTRSNPASRPGGVPRQRGLSRCEARFQHPAPVAVSSFLPSLPSGQWLKIIPWSGFFPNRPAPISENIRRRRCEPNAHLLHLAASTLSRANVRTLKLWLREPRLTTFQVRYSS